MEPEGDDNPQWALKGNPDLGTARIVENSNSPLGYTDYYGGHSTPYLDVNGPEGDNCGHRAILEGSDFLAKGFTPSYEQPNGDFRGWGQPPDDFGLNTGEGVGE
jgi:hypothetical protein